MEWKGLSQSLLNIAYHKRSQSGKAKIEFKNILITNLICEMQIDFISDISFVVESID